MSDEQWYDETVSSIEGDEAAQKAATETLKGYESSQKALLDLVKVKGEIASGRYADPKPASDAKPEEWATWREKNGIPKEAKGYSVGTESQKKLFHSQNVTDEQAKALFSEKSAEAVAADKQRAAAKTDSDRRATWEFEYETNNALLEKLVETVPEEVRDLIDTTDIRVAQWLLDNLGDKHREPTDPAEAQKVNKGLVEQIETLEKSKRENATEWNDRKQKELEGLYDKAVKSGVMNTDGDVIGV